VISESWTAWILSGFLLALGIGVFCWTVAVVFGLLRRELFADPSQRHEPQNAPTLGPRNQPEEDPSPKLLGPNGAPYARPPDE